MSFSVTSALCSSEHVNSVVINVDGRPKFFFVIAWRHDHGSDGPPVPITVAGPIVGVRYAIRGDEPNQFTLIEPGQPVAFTRWGECDMFEFLGVRR